MAGDIQEPFSLSFQADSWRSGSISFGRFENEALCWERRSSFTHNRYLEEVEKFSKPGSVIEKKAYFEARLRRKALLRESSSEWQNGTESQASESEGPENTGYDGDFEHVSEVGHSARFDEDHDGSAYLLKNEKYQVSEHAGYGEDFEHVHEFGHSVQFDDNHGRSISLLKNENYKGSENDVTENTGYDGDFERVNEICHSARFDGSLDGSNNGAVEVTKYDREDSIMIHSKPLTENATNSSHALQRVSEHLKAEPKDHVNAGNHVPEIDVKQKLEGQDSSMEFSSSSVDLSLNAHSSEKDDSISSEPQRSSSSKVRTASHDRDMKSRMLSQINAANGKGTISKQANKDMPTKPNRRHSDVSLTQKREQSGLAAAATRHLRPTARMPKPEVFSGSKASLHNQQKSKQEPRAKDAVPSHSFCTEKVNHTVHESINRDKRTLNSCKPVVKQNGSCFSFKSEERAKKRKEFLMKLEEKMHAKETERHQLRARTQVKKEADIKQLRRSLNFKATPMPTFYHEPGRQLGRSKELESKSKLSKSESKPSASGTRASGATHNSSSNMTNSANASEEINNRSAIFSDSSVPSAAAPTTYKCQHDRANKALVSRREQDKRQVMNSPKQKETAINKSNQGLKAEEKPKVGARRMGNNSATRKDIKSIDLSRSTRTGRLAVGVAS